MKDSIALLWTYYFYCIVIGFSLLAIEVVVLLNHERI